MCWIKKFKNKTNIEGKYIIFYIYNCFHLKYEICGYFDNRPRISIGLIFFNLTIILPFRNKWTDICDSPRYGIAIHNNTFWIYYGGNNYWTYDLPFFTKKFVRRSILLESDMWETETPTDRKSFYKDEYQSKLKRYKYLYADMTDGNVIEAVFSIEEREWRPKWLGFTSLFATVNRYIEITFATECGKGKNTYKGGVGSTSYIMKRSEYSDPLKCLKRMEKEREL